MGYPCLIPKWALNATAKVCIAGSGVSEDGEILPELEITQDCNLQLKSTLSLDSKKQNVKTAGKAYFIGDICPNIKEISGGTLEHNGIIYSINAGEKALNFDGTVTYTALELI